MALSFDLNGSGGLEACQGIIMGGMAGRGGFRTDAIPAVDEWRAILRQGKIDASPLAFLACRRLEMELTLLLLLKQPVVHPCDAPGRVGGSGKSSLTKCTPGSLLKIPEGMTARISEGKMGKGELHDTETGSSTRPRPRLDSFTKEGQLKAIFMPRFIAQVACGIPPLGLEFTMRTMISRELIPPTRFRCTPCRNFRIARLQEGQCQNS